MCGMLCECTEEEVCVHRRVSARRRGPCVHPCVSTGGEVCVCTAV